MMFIWYKENILRFPFFPPACRNFNTKLDLNLQGFCIASEYKVLGWLQLKFWGRCPNCIQMEEKMSTFPHYKSSLEICFCLCDFSQVKMLMKKYWIFSLSSNSNILLWKVCGILSKNEKKSDRIINLAITEHQNFVENDHLCKLHEHIFVWNFQIQILRLILITLRFRTTNESISLAVI